jgi:hypothetical protein
MADSLTFVVRPLNPKVYADGLRYVHFKYLCLRLGRRVLSLSAVSTYI